MLRRRTATETLRHGDSTARVDEGSSFIELLVAIVLIGISVIAILVAVQATTVASSTDRDHARAFALLNAASDAVFDAPRRSCAVYPTGSPGDTAADGTIIGYYNEAVALAPRPTDWSAATVEVVRVEFLMTEPVPSSPEDERFTWGPDCYEGVQPYGDFTEAPLISQKVTIVATAPDGAMTKQLETVKG